MAAPPNYSAIIFFMSTKNENIWIPFADIMTALMFIFILIIVLTLSLKQQQDSAAEAKLAEYQKNIDFAQQQNLTMEEKLVEYQKRIDFAQQQNAEAKVKLTEYQKKIELVEQQNSATEIKLEDFEIILDELYKELSDAFADKQEAWGIQVLKDLTIQFKNPNILFTRDSTAIKPEFQNILDDFIPIYLSILSKKKYAGKIKEIKIEGHTARESSIYKTYIRTVELSQGRARSILDYVMKSSYFIALIQEEKDKILFLLSANGFGRGRAIDASGKFVLHTQGTISSNSRRVVFKVVTNSDELVNQLIKTN